MFFSDNIYWNNAFNDFAKDKEHFKYLAYYESKELKFNFGGVKEK